LDAVPDRQSDFDPNLLLAEGFVRGTVTFLAVLDLGDRRHLLIATIASWARQELHSQLRLPEIQHTTKRADARRKAAEAEGAHPR